MGKCIFCPRSTTNPQFVEAQQHPFEQRHFNWPMPAFLTMKNHKSMGETGAAHLGDLGSGAAAVFFSVAPGSRCDETAALGSWPWAEVTFGVLRFGFGLSASNWAVRFQICGQSNIFCGPNGNPS